MFGRGEILTPLRLEGAGILGQKPQSLESMVVVELFKTDYEQFSFLITLQAGNKVSRSIFFSHYSLQFMKCFSMYYLAFYLLPNASKTSAFFLL